MSDINNRDSSLVVDREVHIDREDNRDIEDIGDKDNIDDRVWSVEDSTLYSGSTSWVGLSE